MWLVTHLRTNGVACRKDTGLTQKESPSLLKTTYHYSSVWIITMTNCCLWFQNGPVLTETLTTRTSSSSTVFSKEVKCACAMNTWSSTCFPNHLVFQMNWCSGIPSGPRGRGTKPTSTMIQYFRYDFTLVDPGGTPGARLPKCPDSFIFTYKSLHRSLGNPRGRRPLQEVLNSPLLHNLISDNLVIKEKCRIYSNRDTRCQDQILPLFKKKKKKKKKIKGPIYFWCCTWRELRLWANESRTANILRYFCHPKV